LPGSYFRLHRLHSKFVTVLELVALIWAELFMILDARTAKLRKVKLLMALASLAGPCLASEYAVLSSGFRIHADHHETDGAMVRLYENGGVTEMAASQIVRFELGEQTAKVDAPVPQMPAPSLNVEELVKAAAIRNDLPLALVRSVVAAESAFRPDAVSPKGAIGLMQLMPSTAREYGADPTDPRQNVEAGTQYLRDLLLKYQHDDHQVTRALAAYNAGPGAVDRYRGVPPYRETLAYVARVLRKYEKPSPLKPAKPSAD
jgi:soluble lytic murein transglycosylase-like protein